MKNVTRAERKLASAQSAIRRMRRRLAMAFVRGGAVRDALIARILARKTQAALLREDLERRRTLVNPGVPVPAHDQESPTEQLEAVQSSSEDEAA